MLASRLLRTSLRTIARPALRQTVAATTTPALKAAVARPFGVTAARFMSSGTVDTDLAHKLNEELQYEKSNEQAGQPEFVKEFLESSSFQLEDKPGHDEVSLTRTFGNEKIRVLFSIADINNAVTDDEFTLEDEETGEEIVPPFPVRAAVTIEKDGKGAMTVDTVAQDGMITVENVMFYKDANLASEQTAEADWQRRGLYIGPRFSELDESLQAHFVRYLEERGINDALATFLPEYVEYKEQKEYTQWLENMKSFVSA